MTVSWFESQNQVGFGLSVMSQNRRREVGVGHTSRSSGLLRVEASQTRVSQSGFKTNGCVTTGYGGYDELKLKMDGSMRRAASNTSTLKSSFSMY
jgi:hypothetical protein